MSECGAVSSDYGFELLSSGIMKLRPHTAEEFPSSTLYTLLAQFSVTLYLPYERVSDVPPGLVANRRSVDLAFSVLQAIALLNASDNLSEETIDVSGTRWAAKSREKQEKRRKRSIHTGRASTVDVKAIVEYGTQVPTSKPEAAELAATVIAEQMSVLRVRMSVFAYARHRLAHGSPRIISAPSGRRTPSRSSREYTFLWPPQPTFQRSARTVRPAQCHPSFHCLRRRKARSPSCSR